MRIATVLHDASPDRDGAPLVPTVALERDGALYGVAALARAFGRRYAALAENVDFQQTVVGLGAATLWELDERLKAGERPSRARLLPGSFTWLPACDVERAGFFEASGTEGGVTPVLRSGLARGFFGHEATVPVSCDEAGVALAGTVAAMLADDLWRATEREAGQAILGYTLLLRWRVGASAGVQLGPVLVTRDEVGSIDGLRALTRIDGVAQAAPASCAPAFSAAESIAWLSHQAPLRAGDVIAVGPLRAASERDDECVALAFGTRADFTVERLGRLAGRVTQGPAMRPWRRGSAGI